MNTIAWALLVWHAAILAALAWAAPRFLTRDQPHLTRRRIVVSIAALMAAAPCVIVPVYARTGAHLGVMRFITFLSLPALAVVANQTLLKDPQFRREMGDFDVD